MHSGADEVFDRHDLWEALHQQVAKGKIRQLGVSLGGDDLHQARRVDQVGADVAQVGYNRLDRSAEQGILPACLDQDLGVIVREPLANGYLSGSYRPGGWVTATDDWRSGHDPAEVQRKLELVDELRRTEVPEGMTMAQWAIACAHSTLPSAVSSPGPDRSSRCSPTPPRPTWSSSGRTPPGGGAVAATKPTAPELPCHCADQPRVAPNTRPRA
jgi:aryl-alcohol dehydrogenase-like predicted oxidoreductase